METKVSLLLVCGLYLAGFVTADDPVLISEASNTTQKKVIHNKPIVIHTQLENYEQPTLEEYQKCHEEARTCRARCAGVADVEACERKCPVCPELIKEEKVVQGVNDTRPVQTHPLNTTNIIRLTNQIHNIIDNSHGNITIRNNNAVQLHQNVSRVGGQFGLGYNNTNPCCIVLRSKGQCDMQKFSTASRCHRKRNRVCGPQCKARVMSAKVVTECDHPNPMEYFEESAEENCRQTIKYAPYHSRNFSQRSNRCSYIPNWPFVSCAHSQQHAASHGCRACTQLTYEYIIRYGIPMQCQPCLRSFSRPTYNDFSMFGMYPQPLWAPQMEPPFEDMDYNYYGNGEWKPEKAKCISPEGDITDDCPQIESSGGDERWNEEYYVDDYDNDNVVRRRRQTSFRPKYSRRYRQ